MENVRSFGDWLKLMMAEQGYSKSSLNRATGIDRAHIRRMETGEIEMPETATRARLHQVFGTSDEVLEGLGILVRREYARPDGTVMVEYKAGVPSPAADIGEHAAIASLLEDMPDEAVQHLRRFLEAVRDG